MFRATVLSLLFSLAMLSSAGRAAEGPEVMAVGAWSKPVADSRGHALRGRLVIGEKVRSDGRRETPVYVELQEASDFIGGPLLLYCEMGRHDFRPDYKQGLNCELRGKDDKLMESTAFAFGGATPKSEWVTLPTDGTIRLRATPFGIHREKALAICPHLNRLWIIPEDDPQEYSLSGTFAIDPAQDVDPPGKEHVWRGTIELPPVKLVGRRK